jgi:hypothetical protein
VGDPDAGRLRAAKPQLGVGDPDAGQLRAAKPQLGVGDPDAGRLRAAKPQLGGIVWALRGKGRFAARVQVGVANNSAAHGKD